MWIVVIIFGLLFLFFGLFLFLRKMQYDYLHNNLSELVDHIGGEVIRRGFASVPFFHTKYENGALVVNFSSLKSEKGQREYYATFSGEIDVPANFSLMSLEWLKAHPVEENKEIETRQIENLRVSSTNKNIITFFEKNPKLIAKMAGLDGFVYFFSSVRGIMFEIAIKNFSEGSKVDLLMPVITDAYGFVRQIKQEYNA